MPSGIKMLKFLGGIVEVVFVLSFVYEFGKEVGRKEQQDNDALLQNDNSISMKELTDIIKQIDKNAIEKARPLVAIK